MSISKLYKAFGFSLIELMVVIAIVGILAGVSIPSYYSYINRTKIAEAVNVASYWMNETVTYYLTNDVLPVDQLVLSPNAIGYNTFALGDSNGPFAIYYQNYSSSGSQIWVSVAGLSGVPGYVNPTSLPLDVYIYSNAQYSVVSMGLRINNNIAEFECGTRTPNDYMSIPLDLLPSACTCSNLLAWTTGGACSDP